MGSVLVAHANNITVNSKLDTSGNASICTLRDAIIAANTNTATGGCQAGAAGPDTINFSLGNTCLLTQCTIILSSALPAVTQDLNIHGSPDNPTISGVNLYRVFDLGAVVVNLSNLRLTNGQANDGAAIRMSGTTLTVTNMTFAGNHVSLAGGAIDQLSGTLNVFNSAFNANTALNEGGAIRQSGDAVISGSSFSSNTAVPSTGGAIYSADG